jgi:ATP-dependent RNA circularization protein (DNA/RNA ligase family)
MRASYSYNIFRKRNVSSAARNAKRNQGSGYSGSRIAVHETANAEWHFPQENATFRYPEQGTCILEPLNPLEAIGWMTCSRCMQ